MEDFVVPSFEINKPTMDKPSNTKTGSGSFTEEVKKNKKKQKERKLAGKESKVSMGIKLSSRSASKTNLKNSIPISRNATTSATIANLARKKSLRAMDSSVSSTLASIIGKTKSKIDQTKSKELIRIKNSASRLINKKGSSTILENKLPKSGKKKSSVKNKLKKTKSIIYIDSLDSTENIGESSTIPKYSTDPSALLHGVSITKSVIQETVTTNENANTEAPLDNSSTEKLNSEIKTPKSDDKIERIGSKPEPPSPLPRNANMLDLNLYIKRINDYIQKLGYHHNGEPAIRINTQLSFRHQLQTAKQLIRAGENIKCLHALVLGIYFTNPTPLIERFPINFKSNFNGREYKHVVLGIYVYGKFGAIGISRDAGLEDKPPQFGRLVDLLTNYWDCYTESGHVLLEIKVGGIVQRDPHSLATIPWKVGQILHVSKMTTPQQWHTEVERIAKLLRIQMGPLAIRQIRPPEMIMPRSLLQDKEQLMSVRGTTADLIAERNKMLQKLKTEALAKANKKANKFGIVKASIKTIPLAAKSSKKKLNRK